MDDEIASDFTRIFYTSRRETGPSMSGVDSSRGHMRVIPRQLDLKLPRILWVTISIPPGRWEVTAQKGWAMQDALANIQEGED